ncbi:MAG TPA: winged helix-turn-helix domain-containing protein [Terriglobales bacterium]|nr:winged helix-turn-helix domain-containing protein [Terriglobales bacterium]
MARASVDACMPGPIIRFNDTELDLGRYELRRNGGLLRLERLPMELLVLLASKQGELVTREEVIERLWGKGVYLDAEQGINTAIRKIRICLHDRAENPKYIQTVVGKGYRLVPPVTVLEPPTATSVQGKAAIASSAPAATPTPTPVRTSFRASSAGRRTLFAGAIVAVVLALAIGWYRYTHRTSARTPISAIAVLPLENLSGDPSQEYFADGMTDELITHLAQVKSLRVISRTSVMQYKQIRKPLPEIARTLQVDAIVEGSVARSGDKVRITAQLIDARSDRHVWAEEFEANAGDVLELQRQVARAITQAVSLNTADLERLTSNAATRVNPEAYDAYLKCRYFWSRRTAADLQRSVKSCEEAVARDPNFAQAWAQLADSYILSAAYGGKQTIQAVPRAKAAAMKAVFLDNELGDGHTSLGLLNEEEWKWQEAGFEYDTAIRLNPSSARGHQLYAHYLSVMGRHEESLRQMLLAQQLDPISLIIRTNLGEVLGNAHRFEESAAACLKVIELDAGFAPAHICLGGSYEYLGKYKAAIAEHKKALSLKGGPPDDFKAGTLAHAYAVFGERRRAQEIVNRLEGQPHTASEPYQIACIHAALGNRDRAIEFLTKAYLEHDGQLEFMATDPDLDSLRADARFQALLAKVGLPRPIRQKH